MSESTAQLRRRLAQLAGPGATTNARREIDASRETIDALERQLQAVFQRQHRRAA